MSLPKKEMEIKKGNVGSVVLISMLQLSLCMNCIVHVRCLNFSCACLIVQQAINEFGILKFTSGASRLILCAMYRPTSIYVSL